MESLDPVVDASHLYEVERRQLHAERSGFRISEIQISPTQKVPWHYHTHVQDTFYVLEGCIRIFLQGPGGDSIETGRNLFRSSASSAPSHE